MGNDMSATSGVTWVEIASATEETEERDHMEGMVVPRETADPGETAVPGETMTPEDSKEVNDGTTKAV